MADDILDQITSGTDILGKFETAIGNLSSIIDRLSRGISGGNSVFETFTNNAKGAAEAAGKASDSIGNAAKSLNVFGESIGKLTIRVFKAISANQELAKVGVDTLATFQMLSEGTTGAVTALSDFDKVSKETNKTNLRFAETVGKVLSLQGDLGKKKAEIYKNFVKSVNEVKSFENAIMSAAQTGGNFFNVYADGGELMVKQNENVMNKVARQSAETGNLLGIHFEDANKLIMQVMGSLPGEFGKIYDDIVIGTDKYAMTTEQILGRVSRGIGISTEEAVKTASDLLYKFGEDAVGSAKRMAVLSEASKELGMKFSDIQGLADTLDDSFRMWGNQLDGMVPVLNDVSKALENTNVGIQGQIDLVKNLGSSVQQMQLPMRSFIGMMSGMRSPGGAVGVGLNVERMLQEGRTGEVVGMIQQSVERITGRGAVSLQEATEDPRAQRAFLVQRQMLGTMTGIQDTGQLNRLLEVMSQAQVGTSGMVDAQNALSEAMQTGDDITTKQTDVMATMSENLMALEKTLVATNTLYAEYVDKVTAQGKGKSITEVAPIEQALNRQAAENLAGISFERKSMTGKDLDQFMESNVLDTVKAFSTSFGEQISLSGGIVKETFEELGSSLQDSTNPALRKFGEKLEDFVEDIGEFSSDFSENIMESIKNSYSFSAGTWEPQLAADYDRLPMNEKEKFEFEPLTVKVDLTVKDEDGNVMVDKIYDIVSSAMKTAGRRA